MRVPLKKLMLISALSTFIWSLINFNLTNLSSNIFQQRISLVENIKYPRLPKFKIGNVKVHRHTIVAIPSVVRENANYLPITLSGLVGKLNPSLRNKVGFVVYLADDNDNIFHTISHKIQQRFSNEIEEGLIEIISPPVELHANWKSELFNNFGDSMLRNQWRSKENLDMEYLMRYSMNHINANFFLMVEDDMEPVDNYMDKVIEFAEEKPSTEWEYCSFTDQCGAGKLFHRDSLARYADLIKIFWNVKPLDWIMWDLLRIRYCGYNGEPIDKCIARGNQDIRKCHEDLFTHIGKKTSRPQD